MKNYNKGMWGYGIGYIGQSSLFLLVATYFSLFLTNCVGLSAAQAGSIISVAMVIETIAGIVVGELSDNCTSRMGRRRPFILWTGLALPIITISMFHMISGSMQQKIIYYFALNILYRVSFSAYEIPYSAFGAEIAQDYDQRTRLRSMTRIFSIIGECAVYILPLRLLKVYEDQPEEAWAISSMTVALMTLTSFMASFLMTKEPVLETAGKKVRKRLSSIFGVIQNYRDLIRLRAMRILIVYKVSFSVVDAIYNVATTYFLIYCIGLNMDLISNLYLIMLLMFAIMLPVNNKVALKLGKAEQQRLVFALTAAVSLILFITGKTTVLVGGIMLACLALQQSAFWQLSHSIFYDVVEVDEFVSGKRREGNVISMASVIGTAISAIAIQMFGILFDASGFSPAEAVQAASVGQYLRVAYMLVPAVCSFICFLAMSVFPINKENFAILQQVIAEKNNGTLSEENRKVIERMI